MAMHYNKDSGEDLRLSERKREYLERQRAAIGSDKLDAIFAFVDGDPKKAFNLFREAQPMAEAAQNFNLFCRVFRRYCWFYCD